MGSACAQAGPAPGFCARFAHGRLDYTVRSVLHDQGSTTGSADALHRRPRLPIYMDERNKLHVVRDISSWRFPIAAVATFLLLTLRYAARGAWLQWQYAVSGWWAGMRGERGVPPVLL